MYERMMDEMVSDENARKAWEAVRRNKGSAGIDRMTIGTFEEHLNKNWDKIREKLLSGKYAPSPVRRVEIAKPDGGKRMLGIPTVQDRFIQQMLLQAMQAVFEPKFSDRSYGFRPGRSAHDAVRKAQSYALSGKTWVVDIDISKFFDHVNHDILMSKVGQTIRDKRILRLIGRYLRSGAMEGGVVMETTEGTPQGGPLSPLLANIYLDALDKELEQRGLDFCRYADDCNIYVGSRRAAENAMGNIVKWIEENLRLKINAGKSGIGRPQERKFLGFTINKHGLIEVAKKSIERFKEKVKFLWRSCQSLSSEQLRDNWRTFVRGWWNYYRIAEERRRVFSVEGWIRRHIRKCFWLRWHNSEGRMNALKTLGVSGKALLSAKSGKGAWLMARSPSLQDALRSSVLDRYGFLMPSNLLPAT
jgi:group II intron reverse transcriptase/maturase